MTKYFLLIVSTLFLFYLNQIASAKDGQKKSRAASAGCQWKPFHSKALAIRLLFESCQDPKGHYEIREHGPWLEQHRPSDPVTFAGPAIVRVLTKPANQSIQEAIERITIRYLKPEAKASCKVVPLQNSPVAKHKQTFEVVPTGAYEKKILLQLKHGPRDFGCGRYGKAQERQYFEYHPEQSKTMFAFVVFGMDEHPLFDENSIEFLNP